MIMKNAPALRLERAREHCRRDGPGLFVSATATAAGIPTVATVATRCLQGEGPGCHRAADAVLDGNGLNRGGCGEGQRRRIQAAGRSRRAAVRGVADVCAFRTGDAHLGGLRERRGSADDRGVHGLLGRLAATSAAGV